MKLDIELPEGFEAHEDLDHIELRLPSGKVLCTYTEYAQVMEIRLDAYKKAYEMEKASCKTAVELLNGRWASYGGTDGGFEESSAEDLKRRLA